MLGAELSRLRTLRGAKWTSEPPDVIPAWVADMDFDPAEPIKDAMRAIIDRGDLGYNFSDRNQLARAWGDWQERYFGWRPPEDECRVFTATLHALGMILDLTTEPDDGVVMFTPIYHPFRDITTGAGRRIVDVALDGPDWRLDPDRFEAAIDERTKLVLFANPHNPLGRMFDAEELAGFAEVAARHNLLVISDEIWCDLTFGGTHLPTWPNFPELAERTVTLGSASKSFNLAGLRTAIVHVGDPDLRIKFERLAAHSIGAPSSLGCAATLAAWEKCSDWLDDVKAQLHANREHLLTRVESDLEGVTMHRPDATYLAWLDFAGTPIADDPAGALLDHGRIGLHGGEKFCPTAASFVRVNFATSIEILDRIIDAMVDTLESRR